MNSYYKLISKLGGYVSPPYWGHFSVVSCVMSCPPLNLGRVGVILISPSLPICLLILRLLSVPLLQKYKFSSVTFTTDRLAGNSAIMEPGLMLSALPFSGLGHKCLLGPLDWPPTVCSDESALSLANKDAKEEADHAGGQLSITFQLVYELVLTSPTPTWDSALPSPCFPQTILYNETVTVVCLIKHVLFRTQMFDYYLFLSEAH